MPPQTTPQGASTTLGSPSGLQTPAAGSVTPGGSATTAFPGAGTTSGC
jgi:hypothetical protein